MGKLGFDNDKYLSMQSEHIRERISLFGGKLYLEFGGKLFDDYHASRVLPGFQPDSKIRMLQQLRDDVEIVIAVCANDIEKNKVRVCASTSVSEIKDHSVVVSGKFNEEIECDTVVISIGHTPNTALADELIQAGYDVRIIGDAVKVGLVGPAVRAGYLTARQI